METLTDWTAVSEITTHFQALSSFVPLRPIHDAAGYEAAVASLNCLLDAGAASQQHPLANLVDTLGALIAEYDERHYPGDPVTPVAMLRFLMEQHDLTQASLPEIGSQGVVSEILNGKRELNVRQIKVLSKRFQVPPGVFV